ncbi:MAG: hypothetical protein PVI03_02360 [Candidatus Thorarchaeota archaeon]|jgi:hypothetical protein
MEKDTPDRYWMILIIGIGCFLFSGVRSDLIPWELLWFYNSSWLVGILLIVVSIYYLRKQAGGSY